MNETHNWFNFVIAWIFLFLCVFGLISNLVSIMIYWHPMMRSPINVLLAGLSIIDLFLCLLAVGAFFVPGLSIYYNGDTLNALVVYAAVYVYPWTMIAQTCSVWTFVVISLERFIAVCQPFRARWCTTGRSLRALTTIGVLALLYNVPRFFEYVVAKEDGKAEGVFAEFRLRNATIHRTYMTVYYCACYLLTHFAIPFTILLTTNTFMIVAVCKAHRQRRLLTGQEIREHKVTFMMILVVCEFVCCNTLPFVLNIVELIDPSFFDHEDTRDLAWALNDVNNLLVIFNASTTAVIYAGCSEKYRRLLLRLWPNMCHPRAVCRELPLERRMSPDSNMLTTMPPSPLAARREKKQQLVPRCGREPLTGSDVTADASGHFQDDSTCDRCDCDG